MKGFFDELGKRMVMAIRSDFKGLSKIIGNERIYAVCLVTDSDAMTVFLAINTYEKMESKYLKYSQKDRSENLSDEVLYKTVKWVPAEWEYDDSDLEQSEMVLVSDYLAEKRESIEDSRFREFEEKFYETMTETLLKLHNEGLFCHEKDDITIFISISDDERAEMVENYSAGLLNSEDVKNEFVKRWD
ncbi:DUF4303 domain-containing protein [Lysinibacillus xylanilyticus]|uniref:DUF4303 domain-containing protein n=1 Tax=Lysinibacillus xylanilyticus TaxID=582475 RepID=UPI003D01F783